MAADSSILAWRIPRAEETGRLQYNGSQSHTQLKELSTHAYFKEVDVWYVSIFF